MLSRFFRDPGFFLSTFSRHLTDFPVFTEEAFLLKRNIPYKALSFMKKPHARWERLSGMRGKKIPVFQESGTSGQIAVACEHRANAFEAETVYLCPLYDN